MNSTLTPNDLQDSEAHLWPTDSLANTVHGSNPRKADMRGILKRKHKNGTYSYRAQVRLNDGLLPQSKSFPTLLEARAWKTQEEAKRRQGMYLPSMTSKYKRLGELIDRYIEQVLPSSPEMPITIHYFSFDFLSPCAKMLIFNLTGVQMSTQPYSDVRGNMFMGPKDGCCCLCCSPLIAIEKVFTQKYTKTEDKVIFVVGTTLVGTAIGAGVGAAFGGAGALPGAIAGGVIGLSAGVIKIAIDECKR